MSFFFQHEHKCTCCTSQGPDNMALASYLKHRVQLYVVFLWDVIHETVNCVDRALQKSRFDGMAQEILLAWKLPWGPWSSLGFHSKIRAAAKAFSQIARNRCDSFFLWLGEKDTEQRFMTKIRFVCIWDGISLMQPFVNLVQRLMWCWHTGTRHLWTKIDEELTDRAELENVWATKGVRLLN